jgi:6,7-dimethyl-8-ribityllumazine synthase
MADIANSKLLHLDTGILNIQDACIVLVKTEWNAAIVDELENGAIKELLKHQVKKIMSVAVPGAVEIPYAIRSYWESTGTNSAIRPDAFIALGCVIRGGTPHFEYVCRSVTDGITQLNLTLGSPVVFGVLTVDNEEQARERIGGKHGHKGEEAALTALKMISIQRSFNKNHSS